MMTTAEKWLISILDCGIADLSILDGVEYETGEVLDVAKTFDESLSLCNVMAAVFEIGRRRLQETIDERIIDIEDEIGEPECHENDEYRSLLSLDPWEDIGEYHNYLDTRVWFDKHEDEYRRYLEAACDKFEQETGYCLFD